MAAFGAHIWSPVLLQGWGRLRGGRADRRASREDPPGAGAGLTLLAVPQALQAPACHENLVKVGGYILGEFGNLIAGDPRSR